jgi:hypothetical protein
MISPHVVTIGQQGFITIKFTNDGPSTVNHVFAKVTDTDGVSLPLPRSDFDGFDLPDGCTVTGDDTSSLVTCDIGQVPPGPSVRRIISFRPSVQKTFTARLRVTFDESKGTNLADTNDVTDGSPFSSALATDQTRLGQCTTTGATLTARDAIQQTSITYSAGQGLFPDTTLFPCTPVSAGVDDRNPTNVTDFGQISFVDFLDGAGLAPVQVSFFTTAQGITKKNLRLYELATFPASLAATLNGAAIPKCVTVDGQLQIPSGSSFASCLVSVDSIPGGGLLATLRAKGDSDPGWGGIG